MDNQLTFTFPDSEAAKRFHGYMRAWFQGQMVSAAQLVEPNKVHLTGVWTAEIAILKAEAKKVGGVAV